jgi:hypothetical protein
MNKNGEHEEDEVVYEQLPVEIIQNGGHRYKQAWRDSDYAIYMQYGHYGQLLGFEVIQIKRQKAKHLFGRDYPPKELYPTSEDWGTFGKTVNSLEAGRQCVETWKQDAISRSRIFRSRPGRPKKGSK